MKTMSSSHHGIAELEKSRCDRPPSSPLSTSSSVFPPDMAAASFGSSTGDASEGDRGGVVPDGVGGGGRGGGRRRRPRTANTAESPSAADCGGGKGGGATTLGGGESPAARPRAARRSLARAMMELASAPSTVTAAGSFKTVGSSVTDEMTASSSSRNGAPCSGGSGSGLMRMGLDPSSAFSPLRACVSETGCIVGGGAASVADCNDEVLSPSFLVLDGLETIYLGRGGGGKLSAVSAASGGDGAVGESESSFPRANEKSEGGVSGGGRTAVSRGGNGNNSGASSTIGSCSWDRRRGEGMIREAVERWAARADARMCVGSVSYDYRQEEEERGGGGRGGADERQVLFPMGTVVSQTLTRTPLPRLQDHCAGGSAGDFVHRGGGGEGNHRTIYTDGYLLPIHNMVADHLIHGEFNEAHKLLEDIRDTHSHKYGVDDLVVAIDTHNIGVAKLLAGRRDEALIVFHEAVLAKKDCVGETHPLVADSLVEVGILLHARGELRRALSIFNEALDCCFNGAGDDAPPSFSRRERGDVNPRWRRKSRPGNDGGSSRWQQHDALLVSRILNNIGCVVHDMGEDAEAALWVLNEAMEVQKTALGSLSIKAESSLLNLALTQANIGHVKLRASAAVHYEGIDATGSVDSHNGVVESLAHFEEALLVLQSLFGEDSEIETIRNTLDDMHFAKDLIG